MPNRPSRVKDPFWYKDAIIYELRISIRDLRKHIDEKFDHRMLLAEANQWPSDSVAYFGKGDECHMAFHFPIMPRLFMAIQLEDRFPLVDILQLKKEFIAIS